MMSTLILLVIFAYLARWVVSGMGARGNAELEARHTAELARLRDEVDTLQQTVLRLQDEQSFLMRLLGEKAAPAGALPGEAAPSHPTNPENTDDGHPG